MRLLDHITGKSRGREDFRHSLIMAPTPVSCKSFSSVLYIGFIFSVTSFMGAKYLLQNGSHPHFKSSRARKYLCPRMLDLYVELHAECITTELIHFWESHIQAKRLPGLTIWQMKVRYGKWSLPWIWEKWCLSIPYKMHGFSKMKEIKSLKGKPGSYFLWVKKKNEWDPKQVTTEYLLQTKFRFIFTLGNYSVPKIFKAIYKWSKTNFKNLCKVKRDKCGQSSILRNPIDEYG